MSKPQILETFTLAFIRTDENSSPEEITNAKYFINCKMINARRMPYLEDQLDKSMQRNAEMFRELVQQAALLELLELQVKYYRRGGWVVIGVAVVTAAIWWWLR